MLVGVPSSSIAIPVVALYFTSTERDTPLKNANKLNPPFVDKGLWEERERETQARRFLYCGLAWHSPLCPRTKDKKYYGVYDHATRGDPTAGALCGCRCGSTRWDGTNR